jgi:hypothetical protein
MNPFFLASFSLVGLKLDYGAAKLAVLVLSTMLWVPLYLLARTWFSELSARTSVVPLVFFIALLRDSTLLAFNVEYIVWVLLIGSVWMIANAERRSTSSGRRTFLVLGGALLGLVPFAKLQGAPIAIGLGMCALYWILRSRPASSAIDLLCLGAGSIVPSVMSAVVLIPRGLLHDAVHRMIVSQIEYARSAGGGFGERTAVFVRGWFTTDRMVDHQLSWMALLLVGASLGVLYFMWRSRRVSADPDAGAHDAGRSNRWIRIGLPTSLSTIVVACLVVWLPGRGFTPYYLLIIIPIYAVAAMTYCILAELIRRVWILSVVFVGIGIIGFVVQPSSALWVAPWNDPRALSPGRRTLGVQDHPVSARLRALSEPGDGLFIWGWMDQFHVDSGMPYGVPTQTQRLFGTNADGYYTRKLVQELRQRRPRVVLDAVTERSFYYTDRETSGMQVFPDVEAFIQRNYNLVDEIAGYRIYLLRESAVAGDERP